MGAAANVPTQSIRDHSAVTERPETWTQSFRRALPVFPNTLFQLNAVLSSAPVNLGRLVNVLGDDPAMTANVVREASAIDRDVDCDQLLDAVITVGIRRLQSLLVRTPVMTGAEAKNVDYHLWRNHSILAACLAEAVASACEIPVMAQARMAGLLHDLGKLPLLLGGYEEGEAAEERRSDCLNGPDVLDHCTVGRELGKSWRFSVALCSVMSNHHNDALVGRSASLDVVVAADRVCHRCGVSMDERMAAVYREQKLEHILEEALRWALPEKRQVAVERVRSVYHRWKLCRPDVGVAELE